MSDLSQAKCYQAPLSHRVPSLVPQVVLDIDDEILDKSFLIPNYHLHLMPDQAAVYPPNGSTYWETDGIKLQYEKLRNEGRKIAPFCKYPIKTALNQMQFVNDVARDIYYFCSGNRTGDEVYQAVLKKNNEGYGTLHDSSRSFLRQMISQKHLSLSSIPDMQSYTSTGNEEFFVPIHASLEVTAHCNARCQHCYGSFTEVRDDVLDTNSLLCLLPKLRSFGVRGIELTGGECTTHPDFPKILKKTLETFDLIAILSNGIAIDSDVFDLAEEYAHKLTVQICINGTPEYHDFFVAHQNAFNLASESIQKFAERGVLVNAAMNVTVDNYKDIEFVLKHTLNCGASMFGIAWADISQGRAKMMPESAKPCIRNAAIIQSFEIMDRLEKEYPYFVNYKLSEEMREMAEYDKTCGAGRRALYITSDGFFHLCPMSIGTEIPCYGTIDSCLDGNVPWDTPFFRLIYKVPAPNIEDCGDCPLTSMCVKCLARGMRQYIRGSESCSWGKKHDLNRLLDNADWRDKRRKSGQN